ncbi:MULTISPECIES: NADPH-dependent FMN reductase [unclassified Actinomyces]|uniref:NADPH-dependent FMN reductase n=1 Tax=unclassified Actinomyces TaxID=2609248 RepID=UPI002016DA5A|nr:MULTISPECIES: NADPH-dependent FMN reductase [unclassified Actinomyces]MCL3777670.1 NAD(P)H-dependent oxidoreductase [Actinomyces sp. AC-20-1]MCL3789774.1 NAD(P)H-dependent oxidoreductase [Actinomyces sp. 187325]MCL3794631.1 NAD(P)H-dependent oxidoreductase [Actinomyces sp. 217892]
MTSAPTYDRPLHVAVILGSLRRRSRSRAIARVVADMLPPGFETEVVEIGGLPLYDADYDDPAVEDKPLPEQYQRFRWALAGANGVLFVTPENNHTVPACLKNAVDVGSKPNGESVWLDLPAGIVSHSVGRMGGYSAHKNLRLALSYFDMPMTGQPEAFLGSTGSFLDEEGNLTRPDTQRFLATWTQSFADLVRLRTPRRR